MDTSQSVFQNVTSPWMQSAYLDEVMEESEEIPLDDVKDQIFDSEQHVEVKDARKEEEREAERERQLELELEADRAMDKLEDERFRLCRKYFVVGCFGLPLLLFVNVIYFMDDFRSGSGSFRTKKFLFLSLIVGVFELCLWILWFTVFQIVDDGTFESFSIYYSNQPIGYLV
ncbi:unnamed protein product [Agarophyton chilense]